MASNARKRVRRSTLTLDAAPVSNRSTFRVAQARAVAQDQLDDLLFRKPLVIQSRFRLSEAARAEAKPRGAVVGSTTQPRQAVAKAKALELRAEARNVGPDADDRLLQDGCKPRPKSNKGSGGSRSYIPWCKK